jgi:hypothetical protein
MLNIWKLRFPQQYKFILQFCELWYHVVCYMHTNIFQEHTDPINRTPEEEEAYFSEMLISA